MHAYMEGNRSPIWESCVPLRWEVEELQADETKATARLFAYGPIGAIKAVKAISLAGRGLQMNFAIESLSPIPLDFLWGHPSHLRRRSRDAPDHPCSYGNRGAIEPPFPGAPGDRYDWPLLKGRDMSIVPDISAGINCGHYATDLEDGWFAVETKGRGILYEFPLETCPHLWL